MPSVSQMPFEANEAHFSAVLSIGTFKVLDNC
jgi:hypothetical protein